MLDSIVPFTTKCPTMSYNNVEQLWNKMEDKDKKIFKFTMEYINWNQLFKNNLLYGRRFLLGESIEDIPKAKKKLLFLCMMHYAILLGVTYSGLKIISWFLISMFQHAKLDLNIKNYIFLIKNLLF